MDQYSKCGLYSEERAILRQWKRCKRNLPVLARSPMTAHWGIPDPATAQGSSAEIERAYNQLSKFSSSASGSFSACRSL